MANFPVFKPNTFIEMLMNFMYLLLQYCTNNVNIMHLSFILMIQLNNYKQLRVINLQRFVKQEMRVDMPNTLPLHTVHVRIHASVSVLLYSR